MMTLDLYLVSMFLPELVEWDIKIVIMMRFCVLIPEFMVIKVVL